MNSNVLETTNNKVSETMNDKTAIARSIIKVAKFVSLEALTLVVILSIAHFASIAHSAWKYSGSDQWELELDKDGVKVYSLQSPDSALKKFKAVTRIKTTLNRAVAAMMDTDIQNCAEWIDGCVNGKSDEPWNAQGLYFIHFFQVNYPPPYSPREFLVKTQFTQDAKSKEVFVEFIAVPDRLPKNDCCFRVAHMHNSWRYTPLENGEIEVEHLEDLDNGTPYYQFNRMMPNAIYQLLCVLPMFLNKEKYQHASFDFIKS